MYKQAFQTLHHYVKLQNTKQWRAHKYLIPI